MNPATEPSPAMPALHAALVGPAELEALFRDLAACAEVHEVNAKAAAQECVPEAGRLSLEDARRLLLGRHVRGVQIRYRHEGVEWWDTLMPRPEGWQLVRTRPDFAAPAP